MIKPVKKQRYICNKVCNAVFNQQTYKFVPDRTYMVINAKDRTGYHVYTNGNGPSSKFICSIDADFLNKNFKAKKSDEEEALNHVDLLFTNIFFNQG